MARLVQVRAAERYQHRHRKQRLQCKQAEEKEVIYYRVAPKNLAQLLYTLTLSNVDRFSYLFHCLNQENL